MEVIYNLLPVRIANFVEIQVELYSHPNKGQCYSQETEAFALSPLYHISGKAYQFLSKFFHLPSKSNLL
jgi:hypothetical protein